MKTNYAGVHGDGLAVYVGVQGEESDAPSDIRDLLWQTECGNCHASVLVNRDSLKRATKRARKLGLQEVTIICPGCLKAAKTKKVTRGAVV